VSIFKPLSDGEVNFLWWFIQGSVMNPGVRRRLRDAWGMCERHTAAWLALEAAFRHGFMHGPALLYADLMQRALRALDISGPAMAKRVAGRLRSRARCHVCEMAVGTGPQDFVPAERLRIGRDVSELRAFMTGTREYWSQAVCGRCAGTYSKLRCRAHLAADLQKPGTDLFECNRDLLRRIAHHVGRYDRSFIWENQGTETVEDRSALITAAGWCGGWRGLLALQDRP
jgi:hypothetical protein